MKAGVPLAAEEQDLLAALNSHYFHSPREKKELHYFALVERIWHWGQTILVNGQPQTRPLPDLEDVRALSETILSAAKTRLGLP